MRLTIAYQTDVLVLTRRAEHNRDDMIRFGGNLDAWPVTISAAFGLSFRPLAVMLGSGLGP